MAADLHRKILHIDMDAFYASVEQRDDPSLRGRPVVVGGRTARGVVAAASYEARQYGVRSAMPMTRALRLCPDLVAVPARFDAYREASQIIRGVFHRYTDLVEPLSLDEAYLDVTHPRQGPPSATLLAQAIRKEVRDETDLPCSAGVSFCKFIAKIASGMAKPDGLKVVTPAEAPALIEALPVEEFHGVGPATARRLHGLGLRTGADLRATSEAVLRASFGKTGGWLYRVAHCEDDRPVRAHRERKSVGVERTFHSDVQGEDALLERLAPIAAELARRLEGHDLTGRTLTLKIKSAGFEITTRSSTLATHIRDESRIFDLGKALLRRPEVPGYAVRLLGLSLSTLQPRRATAGTQLVLEMPGVYG
jgi:DNA polymerase IV